MHQFFTSDEHYGHRNIIDYVKRPYRDTNEMKRDLIDRHNARITPGMAAQAHTWHLGDIFWNTVSHAEASSIMHSLNGSHSLVLGNHDELVEENMEWAKTWFQEIVQYKLIKTGIENKRGLFVCHYATRIWPNSHKGAWHIYGHSHGEAAELGQSFDVGVDSVGKLGLTPYSPISVQELRREMEKRKPHHSIPKDKVWPGKTEVLLDHLEEGSH